MLTKKDFKDLAERTARALRYDEFKTNAQILEFIESFCYAQNNRFDKQRFEDYVKAQLVVLEQSAQARSVPL